MKKLIIGAAVAAGLVVASVQPAGAFSIRIGPAYGYGSYDYQEYRNPAYGYGQYGQSYGYPGYSPYGYGPARRHARRSYRRAYRRGY